MAKKYIVDLTQVEKETLIELTKKGRPGARKVKRANILLLANQGKKDEEIVTALHTSRNTVIRTRHKFVNGGLSFALNERSRAGRWPKIDDKVETILTTLAQSQPPAGRKRWTLQLLADRLVTLTHLDSLSYEAVRLVLKKTTSNLGCDRSGAFRRLLGLNLSGGWKIFLICMPNPINLTIRWSVLTKFLINWSAKLEHHYLFSRENRSDMITNIDEKEPAICLCFWSPWPAGGMSK
jgi:transposase